MLHMMAWRTNYHIRAGRDNDPGKNFSAIKKIFPGTRYVLETSLSFLFRLFGLMFALRQSRSQHKQPKELNMICVREVSPLSLFPRTWKFAWLAIMLIGGLTVANAQSITPLSPEQVLADMQTK